MTKLTTEELAAIRARVDKATAETWKLFGSARQRIMSVWARDHDDVVGWTGFDMGPSSRTWKQREADAKFIAAARQDVPALLDHISTITAELSQAQAELAALRAGARVPPTEVFVEAYDKGGAAWLGGGVEEPQQQAEALRDAMAEVLRPYFAAAPQPPAQAVAVRVKPLVFDDKGSAVSQFGGRLVQFMSAETVTYGGWVGWKFWDGSRWSVDAYENREAAIAAAQANEARRILSAIDARPEAAVKAEALREVAGWFSMAESLEKKAGNQWSADLIAGRLRAEADRLDPKGGA